MILRIIAAALGGLAMHGTEPAIDATFREPNAHLAKFTIGFIGVLPFAVSMYERLDDDRGNDRFTVAYMLAAASFGLGVLLGHWWDAVRKAD